MKANQFGSFAEQKRFQMGFLTASQRPQCRNCQYLKENLQGTGSIHEYATYGCKKGDFAVTVTAICNEHEARA
jgi:hypothetical protein